VTSKCVIGSVGDHQARRFELQQCAFKSNESGYIYMVNPYIQIYGDLKYQVKICRRENINSHLGFSVGVWGFSRTPMRLSTYGSWRLQILYAPVKYLYSTSTVSVPYQYSIVQKCMFVNLRKCFIAMYSIQAVLQEIKMFSYQGLS